MVADGSIQAILATARYKAFAGDTLAATTLSFLGWVGDKDRLLCNAIEGNEIVPGHIFLA